MKESTQYFPDSREDRHFHERTIPVEGSMRHFSELLKMSICAGLLVSLSACQFKKDDSKTQPAMTPEVDAGDVKTVIDQVKSQNKEDNEAALLSTDVSVIFRDEEPRGYTMIISLPKRIKSAEVNIDGTSEITTISGEQSVEQFVFPNSKYTIAIQTKSRGKIISQIKKTVETPIDYVLGSSIKLTENTDIVAHRVYLGSQKIYTRGFALNIRADTLISDRGEIYTFASGYQSKNPLELKNSTINIAAKVIKGSLYLGLRGADGVNGRSGTELEKELGLTFDVRGANGQNGKSHMSSEVCTYDRRTEQEKCRPGIPVCDAFPTNGEKGPTAPAALNGEDGTNGGNQGHLAITTEDISEASISIDTHVGTKGHGGDPAERHRYPGGKPGQMDPLGACASKPATEGPMGDLGTAGRRGLDGIDGNEGTLILPRHLPDFDKHVVVQKVR